MAGQRRINYPHLRLHHVESDDCHTARDQLDLDPSFVTDQGIQKGAEVLGVVWFVSSGPLVSLVTPAER